MIKLHNYNENSAMNANKVILPGLTLYFSYETIIAFETKTKLYVCKNIWSKTTGKHLSRIDGGNKEDRLDQEEFEKELNNIFLNFKNII